MVLRMTEPRQQGQSEPVPQDDRIHAVRWDRDVFARLERAAEVWSEREHLSLTVADVIRTGAIRRADEILSAVEAA